MNSAPSSVEYERYRETREQAAMPLDYKLDPLGYMREVVGWLEKNGRPGLLDVFERAMEQAVADEREACAKEVLSLLPADPPQSLEDKVLVAAIAPALRYVAASIRARSTSPDQGKAVKEGALPG